MKRWKRVLPMLLAVVMLVSTNLTAFASTSAPVQATTENSGNVVVTDTGVYINGVYYTQAQFIELLDTAQKVDAPQNRMAGVIAGTWWIPGVGQVVVTAAGVILVGGAVIAAGTWIYDTVVNWFAEKAVQDAYEDAKDAGEPTDDHSSTTGSSLPTTGRPNSSKDLKDSQGTKQRRYYDKDGNADMDIDYRHGGTGHTFPHRHDWNNGVRGDAY